MTSNKSKPSSKNTMSVEKRIRDYFVRSNLDLLLISVVLAFYHATTAVYAQEGGDSPAADAEGEGGSPNGEASEGEEEEEEEEYNSEIYAILFPWFMEIVGVVAYYFLSRYLHAIPYTAVMFSMGAIIGFSLRTTDNHVAKSALTWTGINGTLLLLIFLPGLVFLDSYNIDVHFFRKAFWQIVIFAFPMVLAGTFLTCGVAYYVLPYDWPFNLCMVFGAITSATDPVAVSALLNELGAPPRLKMHISGESLLNDGSAVVFFEIFLARYTFMFGVPGVGENVGWGVGVKMFAQLAFGGAAIGVAFGLGAVIILYNLNRRLSGEDAVAQVVVTITLAYLVYFTSEELADCSGILGVLFCGLTIKALGERFYNDVHLSVHFWEITESLLNTLLFSLGGVVWGDIMYRSHSDEYTETWTGTDWAYLLLVFVLLIVIRFFLIFAFYPITSRMGIGQSIKEAIFMSYGGLRGAVGIALALVLYNETVEYTGDDGKWVDYSSKVFGMVGGIAFLTLIVSAPSSGPLLKVLGLVTPTETRKKVVENYRRHMVQFTVKELVIMLTQERFHDMDFVILRDFVPSLKDVTYEQLVAAVKKHKESSPSLTYEAPNLQSVISYLDQPTIVGGGNKVLSSRSVATDIQRSRGNRATVFNPEANFDKSEVQEERIIFLNIIKSSYEHFILSGELNPRSFVASTLGEAWEYSMDAAGKGLELNTWDTVEVASGSSGSIEGFVTNAFTVLKRRQASKEARANMRHRNVVITRIRQIYVFIAAHKRARDKFKNEFTRIDDSLTAAEKIVLDECDANIALAQEELDKIDPDEVKLTKSQYAAQILLNKESYYIEDLQKHGLMTEKEAGGFIEEIEEHLLEVWQVNETSETTGSTTGTDLSTPLLAA